MRGARTYLYGLMMAACLVLVSGPAMAKKSKGTVKEAKEKFEVGVDLFEKEDFSAALAAFKESYELRPHWSVRYNIGLCYLELGFLAAGAIELALYLEEGGKDVKSSAAKDVNARLIDLLPELGSIVMFGNIKGLSVEVDGKPVEGPTEKGELYVGHGSFNLTLIRDDKVVLEKEMSIEKGEIIEMDIDDEIEAYLEQHQDSGSDTGSAVEPAPDPDPIGIGVSGGEENVEETGDKPNEKPMVKRLWLWVALGLTGATLAVGTAMGVLAVQERDAMRDDEDRYRLLEEAGAGDDELLPVLSSRNDHHKTGKIYSTTATALLSVAAAAGVTTIILIVLTERKAKPKSKEKNKKASLLVTPQLAGGSLTLVF
jgi:hypothetical protein